jgi:hypothetical protein
MTSSEMSAGRRTKSGAFHLSLFLLLPLLLLFANDINAISTQSSLSFIFRMGHVMFRT